MEGTEGYESGTKAIGTRSAYEYLQLQMEARQAQARGVQFDPFDSNVARLKQQQLRAAFQNLRMMGAPAALLERHGLSYGPSGPGQREHRAPHRAHDAASPPHHASAHNTNAGWAKDCKWGASWNNLASDGCSMAATGAARHGSSADAAPPARRRLRCPPPLSPPPSPMLSFLPLLLMPLLLPIMLSPLPPLPLSLQSLALPFALPRALFVLSLALS